MCYGCKAQLDAIVLAVPLEELAFELGPVIRNDAVWDSEAAYNGFEECYCSPLGHVHHRGNLRPLCELVDGDVEEPVPATALGNGPRMSTPDTVNSHEGGIICRA
jgi:hypothetical protein